MKALRPNLCSEQEDFPGRAECLTPQRVRCCNRVGPFAGFLPWRKRCGLGYLFSVVFAHAKGARRLRRFRGGQSSVCSECQGRGMVPRLTRPKGRAPAVFGVGCKYGLGQAALRGAVRIPRSALRFRGAAGTAGGAL